MEARKLGFTDLDITTIGLGAWAMGGAGWKYGWGEQDDNESIQTIHRAIDVGINWIDTAAVYGLGHSEEVVGKALKGLPGKPYIFTKCGRIGDRNNNLYSDLRRESVLKEVDDSLRRLQVDVIDLYQLHWPKPLEQIEEAWDTIAGLVKTGKVRYAGVSNFSVKQMKRIQDIHPIASLQPPYSMLKRWVEEDQLEFCAQNNIGVIVYSPMQKGLLTGKITKERMQNMSESDHRCLDPIFNEPELSVNLDFVESLKPITEKDGGTLAQLALAWVLRRPEVTAAIVGSRKPSQIEETVQAGNWTLTDEDIELIENLLSQRKDSLRQLNENS